MPTAIGKKIEKELRRQGIKITAFAVRINCTRNNVYSIFKRQSVNTELLNKIAAVLNVDPSFFYATQKEYKTAHPPRQVEEVEEGYKPAANQLELQQKLIAFMEDDKKNSDEKIRQLEETIKKLEEKIKRLSNRK